MTGPAIRKYQFGSIETPYFSAHIVSSCFFSHCVGPFQTNPFFPSFRLALENTKVFKCFDFLLPETSTTKINAILKTDWRSTDRIGLRTDPTAQSISRFPLITERNPLVKRIGVTRPREVGVRTWLVRATIQFYSQVFSFLRSLLSVSKFDFFDF